MPKTSVWPLQESVAGISGMPLGGAPLLMRGLELERSELLLLRRELERIDARPGGGDTASWQRRSRATPVESPGSGRVRGCLSASVAIVSCSSAATSASCRCVARLDDDRGPHIPTDQQGSRLWDSSRAAARCPLSSAAGKHERLLGFAADTLVEMHGGQEHDDGDRLRWSPMSVAGAVRV